MVWPVGQPAGARLMLALRSREIWQEVAEAASLDITARGSLHAAYRDDEAAVIEEFAACAPAHGYDCRWLDPEAARDLSPGLRREGLLGALWSQTELVVDPRQAARNLTAYLIERYAVDVHHSCAVREIAAAKVETSLGLWRAQRIVVCGGEDLVTLYPGLFAASGLFPVKLQMMRTAPQPGGWNLGPALAAGLTLRFYPSFRICTTLTALERRIADETPEYDRYGIHVMASQTPAGEVTIGDSHVYGDEISIFDQASIDELILRYLGEFLALPAPAIAERWHGIYSKHADLPYFVASPEPGVHVVTGLGGAGMTLSFGLARQNWEQWT
jgi:FAD dependent oxidoreductase TIGR03364